MKKAIEIIINYDDGSMDYAKDDQAEQIMSWYQHGESMAIVHGSEYKGQKFTKMPAPTIEEYC